MFEKAHLMLRLRVTDIDAAAMLIGFLSGGCAAGTNKFLGGLVVVSEHQLLAEHTDRSAQP